MGILVTGAAGFIGRHTVDLLVGKGYEIIALDNDTYRLTGLPELTRKLACDITDIEQLGWAFEESQPDAVIHLAAQSCVAVSMKDWVEDAQQNIIGTINVIQCCQRYGVQRIVFASSGGAVHGQLNKLPVTEEMLTEPISAYGISKLAGEHYVRISGIDYVILRYPNVYGPGQPSDGESGVVAIFIDRISRGLKPQIFGDGTKARDYVYVTDIARANQLALRASNRNGTYNIGFGRPTFDYSVFETIAGRMDWTGGHEHLPDRPGDVYQIFLDPYKAKIGLDWQAEIQFGEGIQGTLEANYALQRA